MHDVGIQEDGIIPSAGFPSTTHAHARTHRHAHTHPRVHAHTPGAEDQGGRVAEVLPDRPTAAVAAALRLRLGQSVAAVQGCHPGRCRRPRGASQDTLKAAARRVPRSYSLQAAARRPDVPGDFQPEPGEA